MTQQRCALGSMRYDGPVMKDVSKILNESPATISRGGWGIKERGRWDEEGGEEGSEKSECQGEGEG